MKLASFIHGGRATWGLVEAGMIRPVEAALAARYPTMREAIAADAISGIAAGDCEGAIPIAEVRLLPVVPDPGKIICIGRNYGAHVAEAGLATPDFPSLFLRMTDTLVASGDALVRPRLSSDFDFEGEVAVVIGRGGRHIAPERALDHVFGYTLFNDASIRDVQLKQSLIAGKNFHRTGGFGPAVLTADEVADYRNMRLTTRLNGDVMQDARIGEMIFDLEHLIPYISRITPLSAGDVILTGTPEGVGMARKPPVWLMPGDTITVEVGEIGTLSNHVIDEEDAL